MKTLRSSCLGLFLALPMLAAGCQVEYGHYPSTYYDSHVYYRDGYRYLYPERVDVPHDHARVITRPDGHRDYVYDR
jgi:hypothetical protein